MVLENHKKLNFYKSLEIGKEKEEFVKNIFKDYYDSITDNDNYEYDLRFDKNGRSLFVEVKYDYLMSKTGNMAFSALLDLDINTPIGIPTTIQTSVDTDMIATVAIQFFHIPK